MNKVTLTGRLARDPELRYTNSGKAVCSFTLAVDRRKYGNDNGPTADFIPCQAWENLAEIVGNNTVKGSKILVEGRMQVRVYEAQDGNKRHATEVICHEMEFLESKKSRNTPAPADNKAVGGWGGTVANSDDIPF